MKKYALLAVVTLQGLPFFLSAATTAQQTVNITISTINSLTVTPGTINLNAAQATAGSQPDPVSDPNTSLLLTTNETSAKKVKVYIDKSLPQGVALTLKANSGGSDTSGSYMLSAEVNLGSAIGDTNKKDLITGITKAKLNLPLTYTLTPSIDAAPGSHIFAVTYILTS